MRIDKERLEALASRLAPYDVDTAHMPEPGTDAWDALIRKINLQDPVLASDLAGVAYDPEELMASDLVNAQANRADARITPIQRLLPMFKTTTVNGDSVPNHTMVRNILIGAAVLGALGFYFLIPSGSSKTAVKKSDTTSASSSTGENKSGVMSPEEAGVKTNPNSSAATVLSPTNSAVDSTTDPTGMQPPAATVSEPANMPAPEPVPQYVSPGQSAPAPTQATSASAWDAPSSGMNEPATSGYTPATPVITSPTTRGPIAGQPIQAIPAAPKPALSQVSGSGSAGATGTSQKSLGLQSSGGTGSSGTGSAQGSNQARKVGIVASGGSPSATGTENKASSYGLQSLPNASATKASYGLSAAAPAAGVQTNAPASGQPASNYGINAQNTTNNGSGQAPSGSSVSLNSGNEGSKKQLGLLSSGSSTSANQQVAATPSGQMVNAAYGLNSLNGTQTGALNGGQANAASGASASAKPDAAPVAPYPVGITLSAKLLQGVAVADGETKKIPVYAQTQDGAVWRGWPTLDAEKRVQVNFDSVWKDGKAYTLSADAFGGDGYPGVPSSVKPVSPELVSNILSGFAQGVQSFVQSRLTQTTVSTQQVGLNSVTQTSPTNTPNFWVSSVGGIVGNAFKAPQNQGGALINVARAAPGAVINIVVRGESSDTNGQ